MRRGGLLPTCCQLLAPRFLPGFKWTFSASISSSACRLSDYYDILGIAKSSTQRDIKAAYYQLSMQYHPDKNQGCENAASKFREITKAYEVLGNYKLRRLYDKGVMRADIEHVSSANTADYGSPEVQPEDDDETKFYKSRFRKSQVTKEGRTPIYDFDEWSRGHYGKSFERKKTAKNKYDRKQEQKKLTAFSMQNEAVVFGMIFCLLTSYIVFREESAYDTPHERTLRRAQSKNKVE